MQHQQERAHPFNTARMVAKALKKSTLVYGGNARLANHQEFSLADDAALLYPGPEAQLLSEIPADQHPSQLVLLDGTWHHAKTLLRDLPAVQALPRVSLKPAQPGAYRIRLEPTDTSLSTVEAAVAALKILEPDTRGLDKLIDAFTQMVDRQLAHPAAKYDGIALENQKQGKPNIPYALLFDWDNIVLAYAEIMKHPSSGKPVPVHWVAKRMGRPEIQDGSNLFQCWVKHPDIDISASFLQHSRLEASDFDSAVTPEEFCLRWQEFILESDTLAVYTQGVLNCLANVGAFIPPNAVLKAVRLGEQGKGSMVSILNRNGLEVGPSEFPGRAGTRLAGIETYANFMRTFEDEMEVDLPIRER